MVGRAFNVRRHNRPNSAGIGDALRQSAAVVIVKTMVDAIAKAITGPLMTRPAAMSAAQTSG